MTDEIKFDKRNYRKHNAENKRLIKKSLEECGAGRSILIDGEDEIIAGNGVYEQAQKLKMPVRIIETDGSEIVAIKRTDLKTNDEKRKQLAVMDNSTSDSSEFDLELMAEDFSVDQLDGMGVELPEGLLETEQEVVEDEIPEQCETRAKPGDIWQLGNHRLMCGDSTIKENVEKLMDGGKADMVFTDPPYGIHEKGDRSNRCGLCKGNKLKDFIDDSVCYAVDAFNICQAMNIPVQCWFGANYYADKLPASSNWLVWDKRVEDKQRDTQSDCELAWCKSKYNSVRIFRHLWKGMIKSSENGERRVHPTQKPIALASWAINELDGGNNVLDLFGGSGSTLIACEQLNRKCFMMELDEHYCDVILQRYENFTGDKPVLLERKD